MNRRQLLGRLRAAGLLGGATVLAAPTAARAAAGTVAVKDEGVALGAAATLDFRGGGVTATFAGSTATVTVPTASGGSLAQPLGWFDAVRDLGLDPTGTADCQPAVQAWINGRRNDDGGGLWFPLAGTAKTTYRFNAPVTIPSAKQCLRFAGLTAGMGNLAGAPGVQLNAAFSDAVFWDVGDGVSVNQAGFGFERLNLTGGTGIIGMRIRGVTHWQLDRVGFKYLAKGLELSNAGGDNAWARLDSPVFFQCDLGLDCGDSFGLVGVGGDWQVPAGKVGIDLPGAQSCKFLGPFFDGTPASPPSGTALRFAGGAAGAGSAEFNEVLAPKFESVDLAASFGGVRDSYQGRGNAILGGGAAGCRQVAHIGPGASETRLELTGIQDTSVDCVDEGLDSYKYVQANHATTRNIPTHPTVTDLAGLLAALRGWGMIR